ncbi:hypothetical protein [Azohydromonas aeria]|uniref:hypothetical protein n=1 Tax=Azohydromonas aeria TaxID=2590212 RepID=UPI0012F7106E|nr:hypothetical protein [Azohydromonas aeria]
MTFEGGSPLPGAATHALWAAGAVAAWTAGRTLFHQAIVRALHAPRLRHDPPLPQRPLAVDGGHDLREALAPQAQALVDFLDRALATGPSAAAPAPAPPPAHGEPAAVGQAFPRRWRQR